MAALPPTANAGESVRQAVAKAFHEEWGRIVAALIHRTGDWDLAEESAQDAFTQALARWPNDGLPPRPGAWLMTVANNRAIDRIRRGNVHSGKLRQIAALAPAGAKGPDEEGDVTERSPMTKTAAYLTSASGSSSPAATRRWPWNRAWPSPCVPSPG